MPYKYGQAGEKKERKEEVMEINTVAGQPAAKGNEYTYLKFVSTAMVTKNIQGEEREVRDSITVFPDNMGGTINWDRDLPKEIHKLDEATDKGQNAVKVKVVYYESKDGDKRARLDDLEQWKMEEE